MPDREERLARRNLAILPRLVADDVADRHAKVAAGRDDGLLRSPIDRAGVRRLAAADAVADRLVTDGKRRRVRAAEIDRFGTPVLLECRADADRLRVTRE